MKVKVTFSVHGFTTTFTEEIDVASLDNNLILNTLNNLIQSELGTDATSVKSILLVVAL